MSLRLAVMVSIAFTVLAGTRTLTAAAGHPVAPQAQPVRKPADPPNSAGPVRRDLRYKHVDQQDLLLDLYYPGAPAGPCPVVIFTHGGGWAAGNKEKASRGSFARLFAQLRDRGFAIASINYRLYRPGGTVTIADCVTDTFDAARYLAHHGKTLGLDPDRFFSFGDSAGGHLAQMLLLARPEMFPGDPNLASARFTLRAGVSWYGPCDFEHIDLFNHDDRPDFKDRFRARILRPDTPPQEQIACYRRVSPVHYLRPDSPPLLMIQGDRDTTIPVKHAHYMHRRARALGAPVQILIVKNSGHNFRPIGPPIEPPLDVLIERTCRFFCDQLARVQTAMTPQ